MYNSYISKSYQAQNLQKKQSMTAFANALIELMKTKNLEKIQVSELCCKADYSRRTYYRLFQSKEDVLCFYIDNLCTDYQKCILAKKKPLSLLMIINHATTWQSFVQVAFVIFYFHGCKIILKTRQNICLQLFII